MLSFPIACPISAKEMIPLIVMPTSRQSCSNSGEMRVLQQPETLQVVTATKRLRQIVVDDFQLLWCCESKDRYALHETIVIGLQFH